jgi:hypothetical protein
MLSSPTSKTVDWNSQINDIFALTAAKPKPKTGKKKCTSHRLLTSESFIAEKRLKKQEKEENFKKKKKKRKLKAVYAFLKKIK